MISQLGQVLLQVTDSVMIGRLGAVPLAASAFASSLFSILLVMALAGSTSIATRVAQAQGAGQIKDCGEFLRHGLVLSLVFAFLFAALLQVMSYRLHLFDQPIEVAQQAGVYLRYLGWSFLPLAIYQSFRQFCEGLSDPRLPMFVTMGGVLLNVFLNWIWIYGNWGFEALGLEGAGLATLTARCFMLFALLFFLLRSKLYKTFGPMRLGGLRFQRIKFKELLSLGVPSGLQGLFEVGVFASAAIMMGWIGPKALAAHQIAINLASMTFIIVLSLAFAANIRVSFYLGRQDFLRGRQEGFFIFLCGLVLMAFFGTIMFAFRGVLPQFYIADVEVIEIASRLLIVAAIFQIFDGTQAIAIGALRGARDVKLPTLVAFLSYWAIAFPLAYLLGFTFKAGSLGVWIGLAIGLGVAAIALTYRFHILTRRLVNSVQLR